MANESTLMASTNAEWIKFRTVRSSVMGLILTFVLIIGLGVLVSSLERSHWSQVSALRQATFDPVSSSLVGILFGQLAVGVIGTLFITSEYTSGSIRTTLTAVPNRLRLIASKLLVLFATLLVVGEVVCVAAFLIGQKIYFGVVPTATLDNGAVLRSVLLAGVHQPLRHAVAGGAHHWILLSPELAERLSAIRTVNARPIDVLTFRAFELVRRLDCDHHFDGLRRCCPLDRNHVVRASRRRSRYLTRF
jgi:hypothetical protein